MGLISMDMWVAHGLLAVGFPSWFYCRGSQPGVHVPPGVHFPIRRGTFKFGNWGEKYIYMLFISKYLYIYQQILFSNIIICSLLNISVNNHDQIFCQKKF